MLEKVHEALPALGTMALACVLYLHFAAGRPRLSHGAEVRQTVFCRHCNWEGQVRRDARQCPECTGRELHVLSV